MAFKHNTSLTSDGVLQQGDYESTSGHLLDNQAEGDLIVADSTTTMTRLGAGAANTVLTSDGTNPSYSKLTTSNLTDATLVTETDTIAGNDNDTTIPTSAAVKDYVDNQVSGTTLTFEDDATVTGSVDLDAANLKVLGGTNVTTNRTAANEITVNLDADISVTSVTASTAISVANGGTGATSFTDAGVLVGNSTGAIQATSAGTSGQVLTSNGAGVDPTFQDAGGGGITDATTFRLSADTAATGDLTSNWEVDDTAGYGTLGTAVTEASGIFTFPSTGYWLIIFHAAHNNGAFSPMTVTSRIYTTDDGASYDIRAEAINNHNNTVNSQSDTMSAILDVTSTSTHKAKVYMSRSAGSTNAAGSTSQNECHVEFIKLGDT
jgi:hypothetical protein